MGFTQHLLYKDQTSLVLDEVPWGQRFRMEVYALTGQAVSSPWTQEQEGDLTRVSFPYMEDNHPVYRLQVYLPPTPL